MLVIRSGWLTIHAGIVSVRRPGTSVQVDVGVKSVSIARCRCQDTYINLCGTLTSHVTFATRVHASNGLTYIQLPLYGLIIDL